MTILSGSVIIQINFVKWEFVSSINLGLINIMFKDLFIRLQFLLPQHVLSRIVAYFAKHNNALIKNFLITKFIQHYKVDLKEAIIDNPTEYKSFNDFFIRKLKSQARRLPTNKKSIVSPADGFLAEYGDINRGCLIHAKGKDYDIVKLLGGESEHVQCFRTGKFATFYLSPADYHRVHMPCDAKLISMTYIPGRLFSVSQRSSELVNNLFARNERIACVFETEFGYMALVLVGAMLVSSIVTNWAGVVTPINSFKIEHWDYSKKNICFKRGEEMGYFQFGSTVITLFENSKLCFKKSLEVGAAIRMGNMILTAEDKQKKGKV